MYHLLQKSLGTTACRKFPPYTTDCRKHQEPGLAEIAKYRALPRAPYTTECRKSHQAPRSADFMPYTITCRNSRRGVAEIVCINRNGVSQEVLAGSRDAIGVQTILITTTTIYRGTKTPSTKPWVTRYAYEDDPTFLKFRSAVWANC